MDGTYGHDKKHYLVAPFQDGRKQYKCECDSCQLSFKKHDLLKKLFWFGLFIPFASIYEIGLYIYTDIYLNHRILQPNLTEQDYPTEYERKVYLERHEINLKMDDKLEAKHRFEEGSEGDSFDTTFLEEPSTDNINTYQNGKWSDLDLFRYEYLKNVATDVVDSHDYYRSHFLKWTLRCLGAVIGQVIIILIVVILCVENN